MSMISPSEMVNISNMPVILEGDFDPESDSRLGVLFKKSLAESTKASKDGGEQRKWKITKFDKTPPVRFFFLIVQSRVDLALRL